MKAVLQDIRNGALTVEEIPAPVLKPGKVLVRNVCSLVSAGTEKAVLDFSSANYLEKARMRPDLFRKVLNRAKNEGLINTLRVIQELIAQKIPLGYSSAGQILEVGADITDLKAGQRVACCGLFTATHSELVSVPRNLVAPFLEEVTFDEACFATLGAIALQAVRLAAPEIGEHVLVYGLGLVGMITAQIVQAGGCEVIGVDIDPWKVNFARSLGINALAAGSSLEDDLKRLTAGYGADKALLCAATRSNEPIERLPALLRQKAVVVVVGDVSMTIPRRSYYEKEIDIRIARSYGPGRYDLSYEEGGLDYPYAYVRWTENRNMQAVLNLLGRKKISFSQLITHRFSIEEALDAYQIIDGSKPLPFLGIVLDYPLDESMPRPARSVILGPSNNSGRPFPVRLGLIGAGNFAKALLLPAFRRTGKAEVRAVCSASGVSAISVARKYGAPIAASDPSDIFNNAEIDAIVISTRHDSHAEYVLRGLRTGKAVFIEKPLVICAAELARIVELICQLEREGKTPVLTVGFNRRFSPLAASMKRVLDEVGGPKSLVYRVNAGRIEVGHWTLDPNQGGGRIVGEACHFVDFASFIAGEPVKTIAACAMSSEAIPVPDVVTLNLGFGNGSIATIHYFANGHPGMPKERVEVFAGGVCCELDNFRRLRVHGARASGKTTLLSQAKGFDEETTAFVEAVQTGQWPIPFRDLYATTLATLLVPQALSSGATICVPEYRETAEWNEGHSG